MFFCAFFRCFLGAFFWCFFCTFFFFGYTGLEIISHIKFRNQKAGSQEKTMSSWGKKTHCLEDVDGQAGEQGGNEKMRRNRLFGWMTGITSAALAAMAAAAPVMAAVSESSPGGG